MATFRPAPGLEQQLAAMIAPHVRDVALDVEREAKKLAPPTKQWITVGDDKVRPTHVATQDQEVPENLRYKVPSMDWDMKHRGLGPFTYMKEPKDETSRAIANIRNCRCHSRSIPDGISRNISTTQPVITGSKVTVTVVAQGEFVVEAEVGTVYPGNLVAKGKFFMSRAAAIVAARR